MREGILFGYTYGNEKEKKENMKIG